jgi:hypothetical protein
MTYNIVHRTLYEYAAPVTVSHHVARLEPRATATQERDTFSLKIFPEPALRKSRRIISATGFAFSPSRRSTAGSKSSPPAA